MIYLDNAASTPVRPEALDAMLPHLREGGHGNPSSLHSYGRAAERALAAARRRVASLVGASSPSEILLTSGGTESNNLAILGAAGAAARRGAPRRIVSTAIEHEAVLGPCRRLAASGFDVEYVPPDGAGRVDAGAVADAVSRGGACLVSMMLANNEVGAVQPVEEAARMCGGSGAVFHTDAVQAAGKIPVDAARLGVDLLSVSAHKIGGPKGAGALYVRRGTALDPLVLGGGQEGGKRSGTENVPAIAGFGRACELAGSELGESAARARALRDRLVAGVAASVPHSACNGPEPGPAGPPGGPAAAAARAPAVLPGTAHFTFLGVSGEDLLLKLDEEGIAASTGSACTVKTQKASHVLEAMGFTHEQVSGSLRLSIGASNTADEIDRTVSALARIVADLRRVSPHRAKYGA